MSAIDNFTFGITMIVVGMGGTLITLFGITILIEFMKKLFPANSGKK